MRENNIPPLRATPPGQETSGRERAFLISVDYPVRPRQKVTVAARQARSASGRAGSATGEGDEQPELRPDTAFDADESLAEFRELATSAGAAIVGEFHQRRTRPDPATLVGRGKLEEIAGAAASAGATLILFDHDLSPSQQRNIESEVDVRVIDRTQLILDIFARHARTREGQLQVELAQLEYMLPRLAGRGVEMSQLGGGIGTRGPGETQLETDRRRIYQRIRQMQKQLEGVRRIRAQQRQRRESVPVATVALVGYTNAGKSTLFNALTQSRVLESARMFATLDPTIRRMMLPSKRKVLMSDTVGFIRNLPHTLVTSFRATLEEVQRAALLLQISDASNPAAAEQERQVEKVLEELEAQNKPRIRVRNKIDLLPPEQREALIDNDSTIHISAAAGIGLSTLVEKIDAALKIDPMTFLHLRIPQSEGKLLSAVEARSRILSRQYHAGMVELRIEAPASMQRRLAPFVVAARKAKSSLPGISG